MKENMAREQEIISTINVKIQATFSGICAQENNDKDRAKKFQAGVCWEDGDFRKIALDQNVLPLDEDPKGEIFRRETCVFCAWIGER